MSAEKRGNLGEYGARIRNHELAPGTCGQRQHLGHKPHQLWLIIDGHLRRPRARSLHIAGERERPGPQVKSRHGFARRFEYIQYIGDAPQILVKHDGRISSINMGLFGTADVKHIAVLAESVLKNAGALAAHTQVNAQRGTLSLSFIHHERLVQPCGFLEFFGHILGGGRRIHILKNLVINRELGGARHTDLSAVLKIALDQVEGF